MKIGILADTHNEVSRTRAAVEMLRAAGAAALIHCGDLAVPSILEVCSILPCYFVFGNHDADNVPYLRDAAKRLGAISLDWGGIVELAGVRIGVVHGHMRTDVKRVLAEQPAYLLSGHAHYTVNTCEGTVRRINPGALYRADEFTVALLDLQTGDVRFLQVEA